MKRIFLMIVGITIFVAIIPSGAGAHTTKARRNCKATHVRNSRACDPNVERLVRTIRHLRSELRVARRRGTNDLRALGQATTNLDHAQTQIATLRADAATAPTTSAAASHAPPVVSPPTAEPTEPSPPSPLSVAIEQVRREVAYSEGVLQGTPYSYGQLISQAAMDYVVGHVSAPAYGYLAVKPAPTADAILGEQAGICGDAALTYAAIVEHFGFAVRSVQFYYGPNGSWNHIADEVYYDAGWHYFDPTFGIDYMQNGVALSITAARAASDPVSLLQKDSTLFWTVVTTQAGDTELSDTNFATDPATTVTIGEQPF